MAPIGELDVEGAAVGGRGELAVDFWLVKVIDRWAVVELGIGFMVCI